MKTLIVYMSVHHGNTEKVARAIAGELGADLVRATEAKPEMINNYDIIGFGSGIYFMNFHRQMISWLKSLPLQTAKPAFIFSTSGTGFNRHNLPFTQLLKSKGFKILGDFACRGFDTFGPFKLIGGLSKGHPDAADLEKAKAWAREMIKL